MLLSRLVRKGQESPSHDLIERLSRIPSAERQQILIEHLQNETKQVMHLNQDPEPDHGFFELGMDSLMAVELGNRIQSQIGDDYRLSSTVVFDYPTISKLAEHICAMILNDETARVADSTVEEQKGVAESLREGIEGLSDDELGSVLEEKLKEILDD